MKLSKYLYSLITKTLCNAIKSAQQHTEPNKRLKCFQKLYSIVTGSSGFAISLVGMLCSTLTHIWSNLTCNVEVYGFWNLTLASIQINFFKATIHSNGLNVMKPILKTMKFFRLWKQICALGHAANCQSWIIYCLILCDEHVKIRRYMLFKTNN